MRKEDLLALLDSFGQELPERMTGNEENTLLANRIANLVKEERSVVVEVMRDWLSIRIPQSERKPGDSRREGAMWVALQVAKQSGLTELRPDIEALISAVRSGKTFLPYYEEMIAKYLHGVH